MVETKNSEVSLWMYRASDWNLRKCFLCGSKFKVLANQGIELFSVIVPVYLYILMLVDEVEFLVKWIVMLAF